MNKSYRCVITYVISDKELYEDGLKYTRPEIDSLIDELVEDGNVFDLETFARTGNYRRFELRFKCYGDTELVKLKLTFPDMVYYSR